MHTQKKKTDSVFADTRRHAVLSANRQLWLNFMADLPIELFGTLKAALMKRGDLFREPNTLTRLSRATQPVDVAISIFKYDTSNFSEFLNEFAEENNMVVGKRAVPIAEDDLPSWTSLPVTYLKRFMLKTESTSRGDGKVLHYATRASGTVDAAKHPTKKKGKRGRSTSDTDESDDDSFESVVETSTIAYERVKDETSVPAAKRQKLDDDLQMSLNHQQVIHKKLQEQEQEDEIVPGTQDADRLLAQLTSYLPELNETVHTLTQWNERIKTQLEACAADRITILQRIHRLLSPSLPNELE